jgi:hypothetical protein
MIMPVLMDEVRTLTDKGDLFESRFLLVLALLIATFLIGYMLIIIAKRLMVVITALNAPSRLIAAKTSAREGNGGNPDPWSESSKRMSPVVFMPGSEGGGEKAGEQAGGGEEGGEDPDKPREGPGETDGEGWKKGSDEPGDGGAK